MKKFIITEMQLQMLLTNLSETPTKFGLPMFNILNNLPILEEEPKDK